MKYIFQIISLLILGWLTMASSCNKYVNPFDEIENPVEVNPDTVALLPTSIEGLHANVFKKTCANSGCHDGTFEPDFRTIESTYNTLVYHPIIKNDLQGTYEYRVMPNNANTSQLVARLTFDIDDNSGVMPLVVEPDSDWPEKKDSYIQNVKDWINNGAKDVFGNNPNLANSLPQMQGAAGKSGTWLSRDDGGQGAIEVAQSATALEIYIALNDEDTNPQNLTNNKIRFAKTLDGFMDVEEKTLEKLNNPIERVGYNGKTVQYFHKITINPKEMANKGETVFFRVYTKDDSNPITEIPSDGGANYIKKYFSFIIVE